MKLRLLLALAILAALPPPGLASDAGEERARLKAARVAADKSYAAEQQACRQRFAVSDCLEAARARRTVALNEFRRLENALNAEERQRKTEEARRRLAERQSPEKQQEIAENEAAARAARQAREEQHAQKAAKRAAEQAGNKQKPASEARSGPALKTDRPADASEAAANREKYERKQQEAEAHRKDLAKRKAERKKPAASALPVPP